MQEHTQAGVKVETASVQLSLVSRPKFVQHTKPRESTQRERERERIEERAGSVTEARQIRELVQQPQRHILKSTTCFSVLGMCCENVCVIVGVFSPYVSGVDTGVGTGPIGRD